MKSQIAVLVEFKSLKELENAYLEHGVKFDPTEAVELAMSYFTFEMSWKADDILPKTVTSESRGYTWKYKNTSIFLPHGTEIRMRYMKQYHYAKVDSDEIMYQGESISPSALANTIAQKNRNAWKYLWIKRPGKEEWTLADASRQESEKAQKLFEEIDKEFGSKAKRGAEK